MLVIIPMTMTMTITVSFNGLFAHSNIYTGTKQSKMANSGILSLLFLEQIADYI